MTRKLITLLIGFFVLTLLVPHLSSAESMLSWDAVTGDVQGYRIYYGTSSGSYIYSKDAGNVTQYPLANLSLEEGTTYYFVVRAYSDAGESENSNETSYAVPSPGDTTPPLAPQGLTSGVSNVNITLNWQANAEPDLAGYKVYYGNSSRSYGPSIPTGNVTSYTIDNLEAGNTYYLAVAALDSTGNESGYSAEAVETIPTAPGGAPPIEGPKLQWDTVTGDVSGYKVYYGTSSGNYPNSFDVGNVTQCALSDLPLAAGTNYYFVVRAYSNAGESDNSAEVSYTKVTSTMAYDLLLSFSSDRSNPVPLQGESVIGDIYVFTSPETGIERVSFYLDDPKMGGSPIQVEGAEPYDFAGTNAELAARPYDSLQLSGGLHEITAFIELTDGGSETVNATFSTGDTAPKIDTTAPTVTITGPTSGDNYKTSSSSIDLSGIASDNVGVSKVNWVSSKGDSGTASGTESWKISGIALEEGENILTVTAIDTAANQFEDTITVTYTLTSTAAYDLLLSFSSDRSNSVPLQGESVIGDIYVFTSPETGIERVSFYLDDPKMGGSPIQVEGAEPYDFAGTNAELAARPYDSLQLSGGLHEITAFIELTDGGSETVNATFSTGDTAPKINATAPTVTITKPTSENTYTASSSSVYLSGSASDNVGVNQVSWVNDRGGSDVASGTTSWSITDVDLAEGANLITVTATDAAGNQSTDTLTVTYTPPDTLDPSVSITAPTDSSTYTASSSPINVSGDASDDVDVSQVTWVNDRGGSGTASGTTSWWISNIQLAEGDNVLTLTATDTSGNQSTDTLTVTYTPLDTIDPSVSITEPTSGSTYTATSSSVNLSGNALDNVGVSQVTWANNRGGSGTASGTTSWSVSNIQLLEGDNVLTVKAKDAAGNQSTDVLTVSFTPGDSAAPVITIKSPTTRTKYRTKSSAINLSGSASDNVGVSQVTWTNSLGGSGTAGGTSSWSISNIPLSQGKNLLTVTATDAAGNQSSDTLEVNKR